MSSDDPITSSESEDDKSVTTIKSKSRSDRRKHQRMWTIDEVVKLLDGISHFGLGKWTDIKNLFFHSASHRTPVDIRVSFFTIHLIKTNLFLFLVVISVSAFFSSNLLCRINGVIYWITVTSIMVMKRFVFSFLSFCSSFEKFSV